MNNYYDKYFKYKMKYLNLKNQVGKGSISTPENIIYNMLELYDIVTSFYEEVYITGSMAIYALAFFLDIKLPPNYPLPNDVDFLVYSEGRLINEKNIANYIRKQSTAEKSVEMINESSTNFFKSFDLIVTNNYKHYHTITHNGHEIKILQLSEIKNEYLDNNNSDDIKKLELITSLEKKQLNSDITVKNISKRKLQYDSYNNIPKVKRLASSLRNVESMVADTDENKSRKSLSSIFNDM